MVLAHEVLTPYELREFYTLTRRLLPLKLLDSVRRRNLTIDYKLLYGVLMKLNKAIQDDELLLPDLSDEELNTFYTWVDALEVYDIRDLLFSYYLFYDPKIFLDNLKYFRYLIEKDMEYLEKTNPKSSTEAE